MFRDAVHKGSALYDIRSQMNSVHAVTPHF